MAASAARMAAAQLSFSLVIKELREKTTTF
jgi:hypothetical protein